MISGLKFICNIRYAWAIAVRKAEIVILLFIASRFSLEKSDIRWMHCFFPAFCFLKTSLTVITSTQFPPPKKAFLYDAKEPDKIAFLQGSVKKSDLKFVSPTLSTQSFCAISIEKAYKLWCQKKAWLVDVFHPNEFRQYSIPSSINIPFFALKTKPSLKTKAVMLVDVGLLRRHLLIACVELQRSDFKQVYVLLGGLYAWEQKYSLECEKSAQRKLAILTPRQFFQERRDPWLILNILQRADVHWDSLFDDKIIIDYRAHTKIIQDSVKEVLSLSPDVFLLIAGEDEVFENTLRKVLIPQTEAHNVYVLQSRLQTYQQFYERYTLRVTACQMNQNHHRAAGA